MPLPRYRPRFDAPIDTYATIAGEDYNSVLVSIDYSPEEADTNIHRERNGHRNAWDTRRTTEKNDNGCRHKQRETRRETDKDRDNEKDRKNDY